MEWISVDERLPPQTVYVLVAKFDCRPKVQMYFVTIASMIGKCWYDDRDEYEITQNGKYGQVTHWMPLPEPPKDE